MTAAQSKLRSLRDRQSRERGRMAELGLVAELTDETRAELDGIEAGTADLERQLRAAAVAVDEEDRAAVIERGTATGDAEQRERIELRSRASVGKYLQAALKGRAPDGVEGELAAGSQGATEFHSRLWQTPPGTAPESRHRDITPAPGTVGINLDVLRPAVFAPSVADKLQIQMPTTSCPAPMRPRPSARPRRPMPWPRVRRSAGNGRRVDANFHHTTPRRRRPRSFTRRPGVGGSTENFESLLRAAYLVGVVR